MFIDGIHVLSPLLVNIFNYIFESGTCPQEWLNGIIVTIPKKGDNELDIVDSYVYLGINVKNNGTLKPAIEPLCNQAIRAVFGIKL